jgi:outer membrane protein OmpA-like peptidoglycan-associated protein
VLLFGGWLFFSIRDRQRWNDYVNRLQAEPGIVVVKAERQFRGYSISGLRDPLATDPIEILKATPLDPGKVASHWEPYLALAPAIIEKRAREQLEIPKELTVKYQAGDLYIYGDLPHGNLSGSAARSFYLQRWSSLARAVPGVTRTHSSLEDDEALEKLRINFDSGSVEPAPADLLKLDNISPGLRGNLDNSRYYDGHFRIVVVGHADPSGSEEQNHLLRQQRAEKIKEKLVALGFEANRILIQADEAGLEADRSVTLDSLIVK